MFDYKGYTEETLQNLCDSKTSIKHFSLIPDFRVAGRTDHKLFCAAVPKSSFQENRANRRPISLKIVSARATMSCFFTISPETVDLAIITCANGTPETLKEIKRRFV